MTETNSTEWNSMVNARNLLTDVLDRIVDEQETALSREMSDNDGTDRAGGSVGSLVGAAPVWFTRSR